MDCFTDEHRHPFFHTNELWFDLERLYEALTPRGAVLGLPLIRNVKTVDPTDPASPEVFQIETAMGAAIEVFDGAQAIVVGRERFLPVKTTNDLLVLRSDAYDFGEDGIPRLAAAHAPLVDLDPRYKTMAAFDAQFPAGAPSLRGATSLTVRGDWRFGADVLILDDFALRRLEATETNDFYEIVVERHRKASTILTSNRTPDEWLTMMADALLAQSAIDRLTSGAHTLIIEGPSYRQRHPRRRTDPDGIDAEEAARDAR